MKRLAICLAGCLFAAGLCRGEVFTGGWNLEGVNPGYVPGLNHYYGFAVDGNDGRWVAGNDWSRVRFREKADPVGWNNTNRNNLSGSLGSNTTLAATPGGDLVCISRDGGGLLYYTYDHATATWSGGTRIGSGADYPIGYQNLLATGETLQDVHYIAGGGANPKHVYHDGTGWVSENIFTNAGAVNPDRYYTMSGVGHTIRQTSTGAIQVLLMEALEYAGWGKRLSIFTRASDGAWTYEAVPGANPLGSVGFTNGWISPGAFALYNDSPLVAWPSLGGNSTDGWCHINLSYKDSTGAWQTVRVDPAALNMLTNRVYDYLYVDIEVSETGVLAIAYTDIRYGANAADPTDRARIKVAYLDLTEVDFDDPNFVDLFAIEELYIYDDAVPGSWDGNPIGSGYRNPRIEFSHDGTMLNVLFQSRYVSGRNTGFFASSELTFDRQQADPGAIIPEPLTLTGLALGGLVLAVRRRRG